MHIELFILGFKVLAVAAVYDRRSGGNQTTAVIDRRNRCGACLLDLRQPATFRRFAGLFPARFFPC